MGLTVILFVCFYLLCSPVQAVAQDRAPEQKEDAAGGGADTRSPSPGRPRTAFSPINLSDQNFPLLSQSFQNISLDEYTTKHLADNGAGRVVEETKRTVL